MTQHQYRATLDREIKKLNERIDDLILNGQNYAREARRHKELVKRMRKTSQSPFWWGRALTLSSFF